MEPLILWGGRRTMQLVNLSRTTCRKLLHWSSAVPWGKSRVSLGSQEELGDIFNAGLKERQGEELKKN